MDIERFFIGIDPGQKGGIATLSGTGGCDTRPYSDKALVEIAEFASILKSEGTTVMACVEKVGAMPGQGVTSMFTFGKAAGFIEGVLQALKIPYQLISPQTWKKEFGLNSEKGKSIEVCRQLFPDQPLVASRQCKKESHGLAEALLMAEYARRRL